MIKIDIYQSSFIEGIYKSLNQIKELGYDISKYVLVLNPKYFKIEANEILGLKIFYKELNEVTTFIITEYDNLDRYNYPNLFSN